jgi:hypothetical protein
LRVLQVILRDPECVVPVAALASTGRIRQGDDGPKDVRVVEPGPGGSELGERLINPRAVEITRPLSISAVKGRQDVLLIVKVAGDARRRPLLPALFAFGFAPTAVQRHTPLNAAPQGIVQVVRARSRPASPPGALPLNRERFADGAIKSNGHAKDDRRGR